MECKIALVRQVAVLDDSSVNWIGAETDFWQFKHNMEAKIILGMKSKQIDFYAL